MLKVPKKDCSLLPGAIVLKNGTKLFYAAKSGRLAALLGQSGDKVTSEQLFSKFSTKEPLKLCLLDPLDPGISILRLIVSKTPYILNSFLIFGEEGPNSYSFRRDPVIVTNMVNEDDPAKKFELMYITDRMTEPKPFPKRIVPALFPSVHATVTFPRCHVQSPRPSAYYSSILKKTMIKDAPPGCDLTSLKIALMFKILETARLSSNHPDHRAILIMDHSHNNLDLFPNTAMTSVQKLFLKQVVLARCGLESMCEIFYKNFIDSYQAVDDDYTQEVEKYLLHVKISVENCIFCFNTIALIPKPETPFTTGSCPAFLKMAKRYFSLFPPKDKDTAVIFGATVLEQVCKGTTFEVLVKILSKYADINHRPKASSIKLYTLLTI
ncbi:hypothetical protein RHVP.23 [Cricetid gammaherpesvirus 2]|uniref:Tegument protein UL88 n=1 Tax=Cricetid gammaherpesvirus 2 TaxID=1605972 RepID=E9M5K6_9GAMA|nr:hypothetical protein RHVP.23 [Cricetid gammaherpesvirus 2]ADW24364.1 hypothetical protein RHVP.23 [Cricetid gammaherpesvirus 2]ADW24446.1 hypothetical protein RHVP-L.23 [Cricetid gammaherpesvirus 2]